jgi:hypothetical protein
LVLKAMYGDKIFKTKADVGWKHIKIRWALCFLVMDGCHVHIFILLLMS